MAQQVHHEFLFPVELPRRSLERFDPVEVAGPPPPAAHEQALARLAGQGLVATLSSAEPLTIVGGRSRSDAGGFFVYEDGFIVSGRADRFLAEVTGPGNLAETADTDSLAEAIDVVIAVYRQRPAPGR